MNKKKFFSSIRHDNRFCNNLLNQLKSVACTIAKSVISQPKKKKEKSEEETIGKVSDNNKNKIAAYRFLNKVAAYRFLKDKNEREIWINKILCTK